MSWNEFKFGDFAEIQPRVACEKGAPYPFIEMSDVKPRSKFVEPGSVRTWRGGGGARFENEDIIFARITPCLEHGKTAKISGLKEGNGFGSTEFFVFRAREGISISDFIYYLSCSPVIREPAIKSMIGASGRQRAQKPVVENIVVRVPNIEEQSRIASILSAYDDLIENNRRRIQLLEQAARLLYKEWFVHLRFPGHEHTKITNGIPDGWEKKTLGDMVKIAKGKNITKDSARDGPIPVVAGGLTPAYYHDTANVHGPVITVSASGANAGYVNLYHEDIWASDCSYISRASTEYLYYLYLLLLSKQRKILGFQKGAAQPHVYPRDLERLTLNVPIEICIRQFEKFASPIFCRIGLLLEQNRKLVKARDLLLPRLMNGDFVCQERMLKRPHDD